MAKKAVKTKPVKAKAEVAYFTHAHNIEGCLRNGSFVKKYPDGALVQYMNGDCMGIIAALPKTMIPVNTDKVMKLLPDCCIHPGG